MFSWCLFSPFLCKIFFQIYFVETTASNESGINHVAMTIINPRREFVYNESGAITVAIDCSMDRSSLILYSIDTHFNASTTAFENIVGNGEIARNEQFLLFSTMFSTQSGNSIPICAYL